LLSANAPADPRRHGVGGPSGDAKLLKLGKIAARDAVVVFEHDLSAEDTRIDPNGSCLLASDSGRCADVILKLAAHAEIKEQSGRPGSL
jgi:hypothetical protein